MRCSPTLNLRDNKLFYCQKNLPMHTTSTISSFPFIASSEWFRSAWKSNKRNNHFSELYSTLMERLIPPEFGYFSTIYDTPYITSALFDTHSHRENWHPSPPTTSGTIFFFNPLEALASCENLSPPQPLQSTTTTIQLIPSSGSRVNRNQTNKQTHKATSQITVWLP